MLVGVKIENGRFCVYEMLVAEKYIYPLADVGRSDCNVGRTDSIMLVGLNHFKDSGCQIIQRNCGCSE